MQPNQTAMGRLKLKVDKPTTCYVLPVSIFMILLNISKGPSDTEGKHLMRNI